MRGPPQTAISRYMGISMNSQKTQKRTKSRATNNPTMATCRINRQNMNWVTLVLTERQEASTQKGMIRVESRTSRMEMPSTPRI